VAGLGTASWFKGHGTQGNWVHTTGPGGHIVDGIERAAQVRIAHLRAFQLGSVSPRFHRMCLEFPPRCVGNARIWRMGSERLHVIGLRVAREPREKIIKDTAQAPLDPGNALFKDEDQKPNETDIEDDDCGTKY
jgi:hypothetical protein